MIASLRPAPAWLAAILCGAGAVPALAGRLDEAEAIERVRSLPAAVLQPGVGTVPLETWLATLGGPDAEVTWEIDDCGESERDGPIPACVAARVRAGDGEVEISVLVGSFEKGLAGAPELRGVWLLREDVAEPLDGLASLGARVPAGRRRVTFEGDCRRYEYDLARSPLPTAAFETVFELVGPSFAARRGFAPMLALCVDGDPDYAPCGTRRPSWPHFVENARVNLRRAETIVRDLEGLDVAGAERLAAHFLARDEGWLAIMEKKLALLEGAPVARLLEPVAGLDVAACASTTEGLEPLRGAGDALLEALREWHNCVNGLLHETLGGRRGYPEEDWAHFLETWGIEERRVSIPGCPDGAALAPARAPVVASGRWRARVETAPGPRASTFVRSACGRF